MASLQIGLAPSDNPWLGWKRPYGVGAGLQNMGNTCYINAALQCLTYTPPLANYMLSRKHSQNCHGQSFCMFCVMQTHVIRALQQPEKVIQPLRALVAGFHKQKQEDAHEFLMYIVNAMEKSCLLGCKQFDAHSEHSNLIRELFGGHWRSRIKCLECGGTSDTFDPCLDIGLDIKTAPSVERSLSQLVEPEMLDGDNAYHCDVCVKKTPALKSLTLHTSPKVLVLVLKRFSDFSGEKIAKRVLYPERLDVQPFMSQQDSGPLVYTLYAVLVHAGFSCNSGHYFCYIKAANGQWYKMDDAKVTACDVTSVLRQDAYLLFYAQKSAFEEQNDDVAVGRRRSSSAMFLCVAGLVFLVTSLPSGDSLFGNNGVGVRTCTALNGLCFLGRVDVAGLPQHSVLLQENAEVYTSPRKTDLRPKVCQGPDRKYTTGTEFPPGDKEEEGLRHKAGVTVQFLPSRPAAVPAVPSQTAPSRLSVCCHIRTQCCPDSPGQVAPVSSHGTLIASPSRLWYSRDVGLTAGPYLGEQSLVVMSPRKRLLGQAKL
ncbi:ubiquitin carboxyl-terminal hydrolase 17-like protein 6 [Ctenodactylus gundi]